MSAVTGPISSLPGSSHSVPEGTMCDTHPERKAVSRIQGETDSFGCEMIDCCEECARELHEHKNSIEAKTGQCDWCKTQSYTLSYRRDFEEGMSGPVYMVCLSCRKKRDEEILEELSSSADEWDDFLDPWDDED